MTTFPKYPKYKDSGVEWLGEVPEHWEVLPGRTCLSLNKEKNGRNIETTVLSLSYGRVVIKPPEKLTGLVPASFEGYQLIQPGDVIIRPTDLQNDTTSLRVGLAKNRGIITSAYLGLRPVKKTSSEFLYYLLHAYDLMKVYYGMGTGMRQSLDWRDFKYLNLSLPPRTEQDRIVSFLNEKTTQIDALIAKKQRQIELLDEQKAILINRAVTRGIGNGELRIVDEVAAEAASDHSTFTIQNSQFKDSGIPWIGPIPKGWEVKSAKHVCERIIDCKNRTAEVVTQGDYYVLRTSNVKKGELVRDEITRTNLKNFTIWTERGAPEAGDVLFTREAPAGEACVFDGSLPACLGQRMMYFRPDTSQLLPQFHVHTIYFGPSATYIQLKTNGSTVGHLRLPDVYALPVLLPPVDEQRRILDVLAATEESQKKLIQTMQSQIQTLQTLRSTLIAHAVTGKIAIPAATA